MKEIFETMSEKSGSESALFKVIVRFLAMSSHNIDWVSGFHLKMYSGHYDAVTAIQEQSYSKNICLGEKCPPLGGSVSCGSVGEGGRGGRGGVEGDCGGAGEEGAEGNEGAGAGRRRMGRFWRGEGEGALSVGVCISGVGGGVFGGWGRF